MRLTAIKLAGFKSFVDPATLRLPGSLTAIVGPNGCGKSNVIDAVRWVLGESSAKALRGEALEDVIFNGAKGRKPVGRAAIELIFDNSDAALGGEYAGFGEIAVKRELVRDGSSHYFLNGSRCRRRDITDIFLGTGLGSRSSYAVIEQGTISRLVEARPEDVRLIIEEAAGVSKYKERRRETENRIRHTRENLERVEDLKTELDGRLSRLQKQADNAAKYKRYKAQERHFRAQLLALRYRDLEAQGRSRREELESARKAVDTLRDRIRALAGEGETLSREQNEAARAAQNLQGEFYAAEADVARNEQALSHARELQRVREKERREAQAQQQELERRTEDKQSEMRRLEAEIAAAHTSFEAQEQALAEAAAAAESADGALEKAQQEWEATSRESQQPRSRVEGECARLEALEDSLKALRKRGERLGAEVERLNRIRPGEGLDEVKNEESELEQAITTHSESLRSLVTEHARLRGERGELDGSLHEVRQALQSTRGRLSSLEALVQSTARQDERSLNDWLRAQGLSQAPRLSQRLTVAPGWERAVEAVLDGYLHALCLREWPALISEVTTWPEATLALIEDGPDASPDKPGSAPAACVSLAEHVRGPKRVLAMLSGVLAVETLEQAVDLAPSLQQGQLLVTPDACVLGAGTLYWPNFNDTEKGVLEREKGIRSQRETLERLENRRTDLEARHAEVVSALIDAERERDELEPRLERARARRNEVVAERRAQAARQSQARERAGEVGEELAEIKSQTEREEQALKEAGRRMESAQAEVRRLENKTEVVQARLTQAREGAVSARGGYDRVRDARQRLELDLTGKRSALTFARRDSEELSERLQRIGEQRRISAEAGYGGSQSGERGAQSIEAHEKALAAAREKRDRAREDLASARQHDDAIQARLAAYRERMQGLEAERERLQDEVQQARIRDETQAVHRQNVADQIAEAGFEAGNLMDDLDDKATVAAWENKLSRLDQRIQRLGPINLAAIQEYEEQTERSEYLTAQRDDLTQALTTLEQAISRIDRETRSRFRDTFERVNNGFRALFPRLFGGGEAYLEFTGNDLLDTGIRVMARPPGKRNASIQLLSGGEKAMTAISLVFVLFELNPAPFCILDEVDASMDDANVGRFCDLVRGLSERVQFILITHNKITMELAHQLHGVTMQEPGVSRLVSVDVDEAEALAG